MARQPRLYSSDEQALLKRLGDNVHTARTTKGLSQEALADLAGLNRSHISKIEKAGSDVQLITVYRLATALDLPLQDLLSRAESTST
ncbi:helix-turn-helix domain-containing protein (plasmid) [Deinococcus taeanensis]|uniref:helix-turn-helix domain-containing protein n=1 Tax=Deinococcus taeanensis TaxID=2737050 RepID=UPI001CDD1638|nr:helix-turn-helix transcriptional regulator [Deinococcus taeanensis]UBV45520.1 helix-turn-helix domain-containing protein [Deinococcus taeanensis]